MAKFLVLHGPNLNLLGTREKSHYGDETLASINEKLSIMATKNGHTLLAEQSNHEGELVDIVHKTQQDKIDFIIINPGAFTHTSVALRDAMLAVEIPFIEVHISNVHSREDFRRHSYFADIAVGVICGFGPQGYEFALESAMQKLKGKL